MAGRGKSMEQYVMLKGQEEETERHNLPAMRRRNDQSIFR